MAGRKALVLDISGLAAANRAQDYPLAGVVNLSEEVALDISGRVELTPVDGRILANFDIKAKVPETCSRCLKEQTRSFAKSFRKVFVTDPEAEDEYNMLANEIDVEPAIREEIIVSAPIITLCRADCRGLCPVCGKDLNEASEHSHKPESKEKPLAVIKKFKKLK